MAKKLSIKPEIQDDVLTLLTETRQYIVKHPKQWTANDWAEDKDGESCSAVSPEAKRFCALGFAQNRAADLFGYTIDAKRGEFGDLRITAKLSKEGNTVYNAAQKALDFAARDLYDGYDCVIDVNDSGNPNARRDVVKAFDKAVELVESL